MRKFRAWLKRNQLVLDFVSKILIGIAALFVSYASYSVSTQSLRISELGIEPVFAISLSSATNTGGTSDDSLIEIRNIGAPAYNINVRVETLIRQFGSTGEFLLAASSSREYILLLDYFGQQDSDLDSTLVFRARGKKSRELLSTLYTSQIFDKGVFVNSTQVGKLFDFFALSGVEGFVRNLITITYVNRSGAKRTVYFIDRIKFEPIESELSSLRSDRDKAHRLSCFAILDGLTVEILRRMTERLRNNISCR